jgi:hypothetical protein
MEEMNRLNGAITSSATSVAFKYSLGGISKGAIISVDFEEMRVWETSGQSAVVERGVSGSTPAAHNDLATVTVRPKFSDFRILRELNNDLRDLSSPFNGLYAVKTVTLTYNATIQGYDLSGVSPSMMGILEVRYDTPGPDKNWPLMTQWDIMRDMPTSAFSSGAALVLKQAGYPGRSVQVRYRDVFGQFVNPTDDAQTVAFLPDTMVDLPPMGAAIRLVTPRDVKRTFVETQGEPRRAEEVPAGSVVNTLRPLMDLRQLRIMAEQARLIDQFSYVEIG